jgi:hypothetical protein
LPEIEEDVGPLVSGQLVFHTHTGSIPILSFDRTTKAVLATKISFSRLDGNVPEQELDLFKFAASWNDRASHRCDEDHGGQPLDRRSFRTILDDVPNYLLRYSVGGNKSKGLAVASTDFCETV